MPEILLNNSESERVVAAQQLGVLNANVSEYFDSIARLAADMFGVAASYVSLIDSDRQWFKAAAGFCPPGSMPRDETFCTYTIQQPSVMIIEDTGSV